MVHPPWDWANYPEPQQYFRINMAALTWGELRRASGNPITFIIAAPIIAVFKLFRMRMDMGERFPREVSFQQVDPATYARAQQAIAAWANATTWLGFEHFTTFRVPEMPFDTIVFAYMKPAENAYAAIYHLTTPLGSKTGMDFVTRFSDGSGLTTTNVKDGVALQAPPHHRRQLLEKAGPDQLWPAHRHLAEEVAAEAGGTHGPVGHEHFIESWRRSIRETVDFHAARGVYVPLVG